MSFVSRWLECQGLEKTIEHLSKNPQLLEQNDIANYIIYAGCGPLLSFLFDSTKDSPPEERRKRLIHIFERNTLLGKPIENAIKQNQYNFVVFLLEHCCPSGYELLDDNCLRLAVYESKNIKLIDYVWRNALNRFNVTPSSLLRIWAKSGKIHGYMDDLKTKYSDYYKICATGNQEQIVFLVQNNPRLAWDNIAYKRNIAAIAARFGFVEVLEFLREFILGLPYEKRIIRKLLGQAFHGEYGTGESGALFTAIAHKQFPALKFLIEYCCEVSSEWFYQTLIRYLGIYGTVKMVDYVLTNLPGVLDRRDSLFQELRTRRDPDLTAYVDQFNSESFEKRIECALLKKAQDLGGSFTRLILDIVLQETQLKLGH